MLEVTSLHVAYGAVQAVRGISLEVGEREIITLIGANGAGKSTVLKTICGLVRCSQGTITFRGKRIEALPSHAIVQLGVCCVPEGRHVFPGLTVWENLRMGAYTLRDPGQIKDGIDRALQLFPRLGERLSQKAGTLSGGEQQMLAMGRGLVANPRLLLLDEPSLGLAPKLVDQVFERIQEINRQGTTILLVEQNARMALEVASEGYVLQTGAIILHDRSDQLAQDEVVKKAYLGA